jgi:hypothetical protein
MINPAAPDAMHLSLIGREAGVCGARRFPSESNVLINENRIAVGIDDDEARGTFARFIGRRYRFDAATFQTALQLAHVREVWEGVALAVPPGVEANGCP